MRSGIFYVGFVFCFLTFLLGIYAIFFNKSPVLSGKYILINVFSSYFQFLMLLFLGGWRIIRFDKQYNLLLSLCFTVYLVSSVFCIFVFDFGYASLLVSSACSLGAAIYFCRNSVFWKWVNVKKSKYKSIFLEKKSYFLSMSIANFLSLGVFYIEGILLGVLSTEISVANYRMASMIVSAFYFIPSSIMIALSPKLVMKSGLESYKMTVAKICVSLFLLAIPIFLILYFGSSFLFSYFFNEKYKLASEILPILSFGLFFSFAIRVPVGMALYLAGFSKFNLFAGIFSLLFSSISVFWFVSIWGVMGAAFSFIFSLSISSLVFLIYFFYFADVTRGEQ